jgi:hypothetical protein
MTEDIIIVQDKGKYQRKYAWGFMVMGWNVFDHLYKPLTVKKLEQELCNGVEGWRCRKRLWETTHRCMWQVKGADAQPGLTPRAPRRPHRRSPRRTYSTQLIERLLLI